MHTSIIKGTTLDQIPDIDQQLYDMIPSKLKKRQKLPISVYLSLNATEAFQQIK